MSISQQILSALNAHIAGGTSMCASARGSGLDKSCLSKWISNPERDVTAQTVDKVATYLGFVARKGKIRG